MAYDQPSKLIVDFGCDRASRELNEVFFEEGNGHGGSLRLVRFRREGDRVTVRAISSRHYNGKTLDVQVGEVDAKSFAALIDRARAALIAKPHLIRLLPDGVQSGAVSSNADHLALAIVDREGRTTERRFTGYDGSASQDDIVPMHMATEPLVDLLASLPLMRTPIVDDDRAWFTSRFLATMAERPEWWVEERYVQNAERLATLDAVPTLASIAASKTERTRDAALAAIASITGWDPRIDPLTERPRNAETAARIAALECSRP